MKKLTFQNVLREFSSFLLFFITVGFVVSCCMMLFLNVLSQEMGLTYTSDNIAEAAKITFLNVIIITALFKNKESQYISNKLNFVSPKMNEKENALASLQTQMSSLTDMSEVEAIVSNALYVHNIIGDLPQYKEKAIDLIFKPRKERDHANRK